MYRLVLQHDDFGIHNMSVDVAQAGEISLTSVYDWETGCIIPLILAEIDFSVAGCDLIVDENGQPSVHTRPDLECETERRAQNQRYSVEFLNVRQASLSDPVSYLTWSYHHSLPCKPGSWAEARIGEMVGKDPHRSGTGHD